MSSIDAANDALLTLGTIVMVISVTATGTLFWAVEKFKSRKKKDYGVEQVAPKYRVYNPNRDELKKLEGAVENQFDDGI